MTVFLKFIPLVQRCANQSYADWVLFLFIGQSVDNDLIFRGNTSSTLTLTFIDRNNTRC
jgi:hypothetical protein